MASSINLQSSNMTHKLNSSGSVSVTTLDGTMWATMSNKNRWRSTVFFPIWIVDLGVLFFFFCTKFCQSVAGTGSFCPGSTVENSSVALPFLPQSFSLRSLDNMTSIGVTCDLSSSFCCKLQICQEKQSHLLNLWKSGRKKVKDFQFAC